MAKPHKRTLELLRQVIEKKDEDLLLKLLDQMYLCGLESGEVLIINQIKEQQLELGSALEKGDEIGEIFAKEMVEILSQMASKIEVIKNRY